MIDPAIGFMLGLLIGGAGVWASMAAGRAIDKQTLEAVKAQRDVLLTETAADLLPDVEEGLRDIIREDRATISRQTDLIGQLQYKRDKALDYCQQFRVRGAVVAEMLRGER